MSNFFCAKGNVAGFTAQGRNIVGKRRKDGSWQVWTDEHCRDAQTFATATDADSYVASIMDQKKTNELKWW